jgi:pilus assembly protein CpaF
VRGEEALDMLQAMNTGHDGSLATIHANSCGDGVHRLEMMVALANSNISSASIRQQISSAIDLFVQVARLSDGSRKVVEISEARGIDADGAVALRPLYLFERSGVSGDGTIEGAFRTPAEGKAPRRRRPMSEDAPDKTGAGK